MEMIVNRSSALKVLVATVLLTGLFYFGVRYDVQNTLRQILTWIRGLGGIGPLVFAAIYVLAAVALLPGLILTTGGGIVTLRALTSIGSSTRQDLWVGLR